MTGRPTNFTPEVLAQAEHYLEHWEDEYEHAIPSVVGLCGVVNRSRASLYKWASDEKHPFSDILRKINELQEATLLHKGLKGEFNAAITKLVMGKHGYKDNIDADVKQTQDIVVEVVAPDGV